MDITLSAAYLSKLTGIGESELIAKLTQKGEDDKLSLLPSDKIQSTIDGLVTTKFRTVGENRYRQGKVEALTGLEKSVLEKFGITSDKRGLELIEEVLADRRQKWQENAGRKEITEDDIRGHELYLRDIQAVKDKLVPITEQLKALKEEYDGYKETVAFEKHSNEVLAHVATWFDGQKFKLSEDKKMAQQQRQFFLNAINPKSFQKVELSNGDHTFHVLGPDGKVQEDGQFNPLTIGAHLDSMAPYERHAVDPDKKGGNLKSITYSGTPGQLPAGVSIPTFNDQAEMLRYIQDPDIDMDTKQAAMQKWEASQTKQ